MRCNGVSTPGKLLVVISIITILAAWVCSDFSLLGVSGFGGCAFAQEEKKEPKKEPQKGEGKKTQETESQKRKAKTKVLLEEISKAIEEYSDTDFEGTDVAIREKRAIALEKLSKKFEGREISVALPIENVSEDAGGQWFRSGAKTTIDLFTWEGGFCLRVLKPTIRARNLETGQSIEVKPLRQPSTRPYYTIHTGDGDLPVDCELRVLTVKLAKEDALKIDDKWTLEISGKVQFSPGYGGLPRSGKQSKGR
jgi:hypothetical protein